LVSKLKRMVRRVRFGKPVVVVSGLPRSGTSMLMKMLEAGGLPVVADGIRTADEDNPKGYYEDERVKGLAEQADKSWLDAARGQAIKVISFLLKELPASHNYQVLFLRRNLSEVLASQAKMLTRRGEPTDTDDARMRELFENDLWRASYLLKHAPQFEALDVEYREVLDNPTGQARRINTFLGGRLDETAMASVVDKQLYRNRAQPT
jgi:hypothetical protein